MKATRSISFALFSVWLASGTVLLADTVAMKDGRQLTGNIDAADVRELKFRTATGVQTIAVSDIQSVLFELPQPPAGPGIVVPEGTRIAVLTIDAIDSKSADVNREYDASLADPITVDDTTVVQRGEHAFLRVEEVQQAGKVKGRASLTLNLVAVTVNGRRVAIQTGSVVSESNSQGAKATKRGIFAGLAGAAIGAAAGGAQGAVIGATAGTAAGVASATLSGERVKVASETRLTFTLSKAATIAQ
jgi:hypothetical protein